MALPNPLVNEAQAAEAFTKQSAIFDRLYSRDAIVQYKRESVRSHVTRFMEPNSKILELNSGTGEDAVWFAQRGHFVHATDLSQGMQDELRTKIQALGLGGQVSQELCSFTALDALANKGPYDMIFSNFAGLNCTADIKKVLQSFFPLLRPGGLVTLVILPSCCFWELMLAFKGKWKTALRRLVSHGGASARVEGRYFTCWYYNPSKVRKFLGKRYKQILLEGLCTIVPPSYIIGFGENHPRLFKALVKWEKRLKGTWPWRSIGDYYIISFKKMDNN